MEISQKYGTAWLNGDGVHGYLDSYTDNKVTVVFTLKPEEYIRPVHAESIDPDSKPVFMSTSDLLKSMDDAEILIETIKHLTKKLNAL